MGKELQLPLKSTGLNCMGPLTCGYFSVVNATVVHGPWLVESANAQQPWIQPADGKLHSD